MNLTEEKKRFEKMCLYENRAREDGHTIIAGVDEAGRGAWAGPVVAAAVIFPENIFIPGLNDSKAIPAIKRELLYDEICRKAIAFSTGLADCVLIDSVNILNATYIAMERALKGLKIKPQIVLIDGRPVPRLGDFSQVSIVKGDSKSISIAAASIIAKVTRDRQMVSYSITYSEYDFHKNKGYGTENHREALKKSGICKIHRKSFKPVKELLLKEENLMDLWNNNLNEII